MERIENGVGAGTPDTHCIAKGFPTWVEHKVALWPAKETTRIQMLHPLTIDQCNWHLNYAQHGGVSFILVGIEGDLFLIPGYMVDAVNSMRRSDIRLYQVTYAEMISVLTGKVNIEGRKYKR